MIDPMYEVFYKEYLKSRDYKPLKQFLNFLKDKYEFNSVLDVGCADGTISKYLFDLGLKVDAIDNSKKFIDIAKKNHPGPNYFFSSFENFNPKKNYDACLFTYSVIAYFDDFFEMIAKAENMLLEKGIVFFLDTANFSYFINSGKFRKEGEISYPGINGKIYREVVETRNIDFVIEYWVYNLSNKKVKHVLKHPVFNQKLLEELKKKFRIDIFHNYGRDSKGRINLVLQKL